MAHISLPPSEIIGRAAQELVAAASHDAARVRAITKAQYHMLTSDLMIVPTLSGFLVPSGSRAGTIHRVSTVNGCSCEAAQAGRRCWHVEVINLLEQAAKYTMPRIVAQPLGVRIASISAAAYARAVAEMDELFG